MMNVRVLFISHMEDSAYLCATSGGLLFLQIVIAGVMYGPTDVTVPAVIMGVLIAVPIVVKALHLVCAFVVSMGTDNSGERQVLIRPGMERKLVRDALYYHIAMSILAFVLGVFGVVEYVGTASAAYDFGAIALLWLLVLMGVERHGSKVGNTGIYYLGSEPGKSQH